MDEAMQASGLSDFGPDDFRQPLAVLCDTYERSPFDEKGRKRNRGRVIQLLGTRLRMHEALKRHPEILEEEIVAPMVLTGLPRSGTSAQFNLLAMDPDARPLLLWESQFPDPPEGAKPGDPDPRYQLVKAHFESAKVKNPEFTKIHDASADTPEECVLIHALSFNGVHVGVEPMLEPYASWYREQDLSAMYDYYKVTLQMLNWQRPGKRWLLKAPAHMWAIDELIAAFPDVCIVWSHRNPLACIASICSMTYAIPNGALRIEKTTLGPIVMDFYATSLERGLQMRDRAEAERFVDVSHDEFVADSMGVARRIYDHFGIAFTPEVESLMQTHIDENPKDKHGKHEYALEEWGLSADEVRERFKPYTERFGIET